jgi:hypothetical protein
VDVARLAIEHVGKKFAWKWLPRSRLAKAGPAMVTRLGNGDEAPARSQQDRRQSISQISGRRLGTASLPEQLCGGRTQGRILAKTL